LLASITLSLLSLARDTLEKRASDFTYSLLYAALLLSVGTASTSFYDAVRILPMINAEGFQSGHYVQANLIFRMNPILLLLSFFAFNAGLGWFIASTQTLVVQRVSGALSGAVFIVWLLTYCTGVLYVASQ
jgi:hypothetical protein